MNARKPAGAIAAAAIAVAQSASAAPANEALEACRAELDDAKRLACYDRAMGRAEEDAPRAPAPAAAAAAESAEDRFGRERAIASEEAKAREAAAREAGELVATVVDLDTRAVDGLMTFTLDNGQVWQQNRPDSRFRLEQGDTVRIQPGALKSYILSGPSNRSTRVTRIK